MTAVVELPVLDLSAYAGDPRSADAAGFVDELREACHHPGFCYLEGHGISPDLEGRVMEVARAFFARPESDRVSIANTNSPHIRGYTRLGMEHTNGRPDWRDQIDIGPERPVPEIGSSDPAWLSRVRHLRRQLAQVPPPVAP